MKRFTTNKGTNGYKRNAFGLRISQATFRRALEIIFSRVGWNIFLVYHDDVIVFSPTLESHFDNSEKAAASCMREDQIEKL